MMMILNGAIFAQCVNDVNRECHYTDTEIFDYSAEKYVPYKMTTGANVSLTVLVHVKDRKILFGDTINKNGLVFDVMDCEKNDYTITYFCKDLLRNEKCTLVFGNTLTTYQLVIRYPQDGTMYRLKSKLAK